ncbi:MULTISPECIES: TcdA/TcdB catalytic glycosyltransferase domain-containing protein [unclassified Anabaena]|uniref:TcdA/TcdB catalytic glycosyltransferase domain-containing protein n=1 Tax=unclassified Anabaena TaxID=2619674 RepID=UPI0009FD162F|nr:MULTISPECIES: TcdA/TcdB catalytic glycosyltransferase domain-containing protein [unclassified Anabaena]
MHQSKQNQDPTKSQNNSQTREEWEAQESLLDQQNPLVQQFSGLGNIPNAGVHAQILNGIPANQIAANPQLMLQMQQQFGNSHVSQVVQMARENSQETSQQPQTTLQAKLNEQSAAHGVQQENKTGLPDKLKTGIENLAGMSMDDVKVHYNSSKPSQLQALAYTQGTDIHVAPGQERHLPHEAWHVVQQKQGQVHPTMQIKNWAINNDSSLEREADVMGAKISHSQHQKLSPANEFQQCSPKQAPVNNVVQMNGNWGRIGLGALLGAIIGGGLGALGFLMGPLGAITTPVGATLGAAIGGYIGHKTGNTSPAIPNNMHFVWLGGRVPEERQKNIQQWVQAVPGVRINLWLDENSQQATSEDLDNLKQQGVTIRLVSELYNRSDRLQKVAKGLPTVDEEGVNVGATGALSDIVRLEILKIEGGTYMDSDNKPGENAAKFKDMTAPLGVRLGWGKLNWSEAFSNDAISAAANNEYIQQYLELVYKKVKNEEKRQQILSRDPKSVKEAVMNATGPDAMAQVSLPLSAQQLQDLREEQEKIMSGYFPKIENVNIGTFGQNKETYKSITTKNEFSPEMLRIFLELAYDTDMFIRASDNAWVPKEEDIQLS